jgi:hypothetical protein
MDSLQVDVKRVDDSSTQQGGYRLVHGLKKCFMHLVLEFCLLQLHQLRSNSSIGRWMFESVLDLHSTSFHHDRILVFDED